MSRQLSELEMADEFESIIRGHGTSNGLPVFCRIFREVSCKQGIADFIALPGSAEFNNVEDARIYSSSHSLILSVLKARSPRTEEYIVRTTGLSQGTIRKAIRDLEKVGAVTRTNTGSLLLGINYSIPSQEVWAFELKTENWRRAIFQAIQYSAFADRVYVVMPNNKLKVIEKNIDAFKSMQIGVIIQDIANKHCEIILKAPRSGPKSKMHAMFAWRQLAVEMQNEENSSDEL